MARSTKQQPEQLKNALPLPEETEYLWRWFCELSGARGSTGFGPLPISYRDVAAWQELTGNKPLPWEVETIMELDRAYLKVLEKDRT